jgi:hypothetical protein
MIHCSCFSSEQMLILEICTKRNMICFRGRCYSHFETNSKNRIFITWHYIYQNFNWLEQIKWLIYLFFEIFKSFHSQFLSKIAYCLFISYILVDNINVTFKREVRKKLKKVKLKKYTSCITFIYLNALSKYVLCFV